VPVVSIDPGLAGPGAHGSAEDPNGIVAGRGGAGRNVGGVIDVRVLRENPEALRISQIARGEDPSLVDQLLSADDVRRASIMAFDSVRNEQKTIGKSIPHAQGAEKAALLAKASELSAAVKIAETAQSAAEADVRALQLKISNQIEDGTPHGGEADFVVLEHVGTPREFDFEVRDHLAIGELLDAIDTERGAKVSGARFYFLKGAGALLEFALVNMAISYAGKAGFTPIITPVLVKPEAMEGTGFLGAHSAEVYRLAEDDLYLVGTSEVPLAALHMNEVLDPASLPIRYAGYSSCFRREAGSYGKDTRGIIRVHQFDKVEMFVYTRPEDAAAEHLRLLEQEKAFLSALELPFRVIDVAAGDLGSSAARKYDCEVWLPSQKRFMEVTSTSNCMEFQARRLNTRVKAEKGTDGVATLNGTLCAITRVIVAILENHQQADGSVLVPLALQPFLGGQTVLSPK
jgi:seryl-tRNA synthetase